MYAIGQMAAIRGVAAEIESVWLESVHLAGEIDTAAVSLRAAELQHVIAQDDREMDEQERLLKEYAKKLAENADAYQRLILSPEEQRLWDSTKKALDAYIASQAEVLALSRVGRDEEANSLSRGTSYQAFLAARAHLAKVIQLNLDGGKAASLTSAKVYETGRRSTFIGLVAAVLVGLGTAFFVAGRLSAQLRAIGARAEQLRGNCITNLGYGIAAMSSGDLTIEVHAATQLLDVEQRDEIGELAATIDGTIRQTQATIAAYEGCKRAVESLVAEAARLAKAGREGDLSARGDAARFEGKFRDVVEGINGTLEAVLAPIAEATSASAHETAERAQQSLASSHQLAEMSSELRGLLAEFRYEHAAPAAPARLRVTAPLARA